MRAHAVRLEPRAGFSLMEMIISLSLSALVIAVFFGTIASMQKTYRTQRDQRMAEDAMRTAEQVLRIIMQSAGADPRATGQGSLDPDFDNNGNFNDPRIKSDFNPPNGAFTDELEDVRIDVISDSLRLRWSILVGGVPTTISRPLAYPVRSIAFEYFTANGVALTTEADVANATQVRITISAPESPVSSTLRSRQVWVFLQNRR